jgi:hypothetical protein
MAKAYQSRTFSFISGAHFRVGFYFLAPFSRIRILPGCPCHEPCINRFMLICYFNYVMHLPSDASAFAGQVFAMVGTNTST